jgi:phospholipid/cholesterol/gamma-HCH transport system permease protein
MTLPYDPSMKHQTALQLGSQRVRAAWASLRLAAFVLVLALSPSTYRDPAVRATLVRQIALGTGPLLAWFTVLVAVGSLVLIRIVVVTAASYGLNRYALDMVVRVLVLELIPLIAALAVAVRITLPEGVRLAAQITPERLAAWRRDGRDPLAVEGAPRVVGGVFAVVALAAVSCAVSLVLAYLVVHGFTPAALPAYTRKVGQVFTPAVSLVFVLKTLALSLSVSLVPVVSALRIASSRNAGVLSEVGSLVRMFLLILLIEIGSLMVNYA